MTFSRLYKWAAGVLAAIVVAALVVVLVVFLVKRSDNNDTADDDSTGSRVTDSLKFVVFISRHGNRGASWNYPNDPYPLDNPEYWPYGVDRLTPKGRVQLHNLGMRVRSLYNGFLNSTFHPQELHASSTYMDRMLISGESFLAGLYPPKGWQVWDSSIPWQPTPLYSDSPDKTVVITQCPAYLENYYAIRKTFLEIYATNISTFISTYENITGTNSSTVDESTLWYFWDKLISEDTEGYTIPDWAKALYPYPLEYLMAMEYIYYYCGNQEVIRLVIGEMFDEIIGVLKSVVNGTETERKMQYYSGHDSTIVAVQGLLGIPAASMVGLVRPGSGLALELHQNQNTSQFYLQVVYIDGGTTDLDLTIFNNTQSCGDPCDFHTLLNNTLPYTDVNYEQECNISSSNTYSIPWLDESRTTSLPLLFVR